MSLVYDVFMYNGEPIVETRIKYLENHVDQFILIESPWTFSGNKKQIYSDNASFRTHPKLKIIIIDDYIKGDAWATEALHRNSAFPKLLNNDGDCFILSDCDEIPAIESLDNFKNICNSNDPKYIKIRQNFYYYNFNWKKNKQWTFPVVANTAMLKKNTSQQLRSGNTNNIIESGWHISYALPLKEIRRKIESFSHQEYNLKELKTDEHIKNCLINGKDLFNRGFEEDCIWENEESLPDILKQFNNVIKKAQQKE